MDSESKKIVILPGDGIGVEISAVAKKLLDKLCSKYQLSVSIEEHPIGGSSYDLHKTPLTDEVLDSCLNSDAVLLGAVGGYKWDKLAFELRPERALLKLRKSLQLFANIRPIEVYDELKFCSPLKDEVTADVDLVIVRELTGDLYFGQPRGIETTDNNQRRGFNTMVYSEAEIERIAIHAFELASKRNNRLCSVDKANVLETSMLWREVVENVAKSYQHVELSHQYVDNAAMQLIRNPRQFDVILTSNMFGDILSDLSAMIPGSIGLLSSVSLGAKNALYEPIHGSAPDIAGENKANPLGMLACVGLMLEHTFLDTNLSSTVRLAISKALKKGRTIDIAAEGLPVVSCEQLGEFVINEI